MDVKKKNPDTLPRLQRKVYNLLAGGGKWSVAELSARLWLADPRGHIAELRNKGYNIADEWRETSEGNRYKVYFLTPQR